MSKKLKVYGGCFDGRNHETVAAYTQKQAAELFKISLYYFRQFACETGNDEEINEAITAPLTVFKRKV